MATAIMNEVVAYLTEVELALVSSPIVTEYHIVRSWANTDDGYIRVRATLTNGDFLEGAEYFALHGDQVVTVDYRYQWMDGDQKVLRWRWDSTPDHPDLESFPYHVHVSGEEIVVPGHSMSLIDLLGIIEGEISQL
jgi:hypothetical protein